METALIYDAVYVLANAMDRVDPSYTRLRLVNLSCDGEQAWAFGSTLYSYLNLVTLSHCVFYPRGLLLVSFLFIVVQYTFVKLFQFDNVI